MQPKQVPTMKKEGGGGQRTRKLNPAFLRQQRSNGDDDVIIVDSKSGGCLETILKHARDTGKLIASNVVDLKHPLSDQLFKFPFNGSRYTEELMTVVDFSDNDDIFKDTEIDERILRYKSIQSLRFRNCGLRISTSFHDHDHDRISSSSGHSINRKKLFSFRSLKNLMILDLSGNQLERFDIGSMILSGNSSSLVELNLSNNRIREIVATVIIEGDDDISDNINDEDFQNDVISLPKLRVFDVSHNTPLERMFEYDTNDEKHNKQLSCTNLRIFRCHHNPNFQSSPMTTDGLPVFLRSATNSLEVLEACHNPNMVKIFNGERIELSDYVRLQTVTFAMNKLETIPCISPTVTCLDLRSNKLTSISGLLPTKFDTSSLVDLILSDNYLTQLDALVLESTAQLKRLDLSYNKITSLPYQLGFLIQITTLSVSGNPVITKFPLSVMAETNSNRNPQPLLKILRNRAPKDRQSSLALPSPSSFGKLDKADEVLNNTPNTVAFNLLSYGLSTKGDTTLDLMGKINDATLNGSTDKNAEILENIILELQSQTSVVQSEIKHLNLESNNLKYIPDNFFSGCLSKLQTVSLHENCLTGLPISLQRSSSGATIAKLNLAKNQLTTESLINAMWFQKKASTSSINCWSLKCLTHLDLSSNRITSFPVDTNIDVFSFPALQVMDLSNNKINTVDDWGRLPSTLAVIDISNNDIEDIEQLVALLLAHCPELQRLSLKHNLIKRIPLTLGLLKDYAPRIISLNVQGNPQRAIRSDILDRPCWNLLGYLFNRLTAKQRQTAIDDIQEMQGQRTGKENTENSQIEPIILASDVQQQKQQTQASLKYENLEVTKGLKHRQIFDSNIPSNDDNNVHNNNENNDVNNLVKELNQKINELKTKLENLSLTQAKKYALKKSLAMERSKLIREERRLISQKEITTAAKI